VIGDGSAQGLNTLFAALRFSSGRVDVNAEIFYGVSLITEGGVDGHKCYADATTFFRERQNGRRSHHGHTECQGRHFQAAPNYVTSHLWAGFFMLTGPPFSGIFFSSA